jgi:Tfp pilus assembly protein PilF
VINEIRALVRAGRLSEAEAQARVIVQQDPDNAQALTMLGMILQEQGSWAEAAKYLARGAELDPGPAVFVNLSTCELRQYRTGAALEAARRAVDMQPQWAPALRALARTSHAERSFDVALSNWRSLWERGERDDEVAAGIASALERLERFEEAGGRSTWPCASAVTLSPARWWTSRGRRTTN